ncbi:amino acid adenylation domain-containing protein [Streptomyces canus]|uniref:non-ribosomal peptide synthetase n=1 Tax=Streptomyces canus TaxID=58343 RepID=UPI0033D07929
MTAQRGTTAVLRTDLSGNPAFADVPQRIRRQDPDPHAPGGITLTVTDCPGGAMVRFDYDTGVFDAQTAEQFAAHYTLLLSRLAQAPRIRIEEIPLLSVTESSRVVRAWNDTTAPFPNEPLHQLVHAQAARTPDAVAVVHEEGELTYRKLAESAVRLAGRLRHDHGIDSDMSVGILLDRGPHLVVGLLAVLDAGAAYLPLDTDIPAGRLRTLCARAGTRLCLTERHLAAKLPPEVTPIVVDASFLATLGDLGTPCRVDVCPDNLVSVYFTSGSTGTPKGVANTHRGWVNRMAWMQRRHLLRQGETVLHKTTLTFDDAAVELFWPLMCGGRVALVEPGLHRDPRAIIEAAARYEAAVIQFVPSMLRLFLEALTPNDVSVLRALRCVVSSGEALAPDLVAAFAAAFPDGTVALHNQWGTTEVSIDSTIWTCDLVADARGEAVPIGHAIDNNQVHLLDAAFQPVPIGVPGEIFLGGVGLARGYLHDPAATARAFVPSPFGVSERLYRTGDMGVRRPDGTIFFRGRIDDQVKIRGIRVEPAETEQALRNHPDVRDAVVTAADGPGGTRLVAYVVPRGNAPDDLSQSLQAGLAEELPAPQLPGAYVFLPALPLTTSGKVDRRSLPAPVDDTPTVTTSPRTPTESAVAAVLADVLGLPEVDIHHDFFALGGHSLSAASAITRMSRTFGVAVPLAMLFRRPTVALAAAAVDNLLGTRGDAGAAPIPLRPEGSVAPLSPGQERLLVADGLDGRAGVHYCHEALQLRGPLDETALRRALDLLVARHEILRTVLVPADGAYRQRVLPAGEVPFHVVDLSGLAARDRRPAAAQHRARTAAHRLDPEHGPLLAAELLKLPDEEHQLLVTVHHLAFDDRSSEVFWRELGSAYRALRDGCEPTDLAVPLLQYADFATWVRERPVDQDGRQAAYWRTRLDGLSPMALPTDRKATKRAVGAAVTTDLPAESAARVRRAASGYATTPFTVLLAAFQVLQGRYCRTTDVTSGIFVSHRPHPDLDELIGFFVNTLVLRTDLSGGPTFAELLARVGQDVLAAQEHADLPYERIVAQLHPDREPGRDPLLRTAFAFEHVTPDPWGLPGLETCRLHIPDTTAKFDLSVTVTECGDRFTLTLTYDTGLFDRATIERMAGHYRKLLDTLADTPEITVDGVSLLTDDEHRRIVTEWNDTAVPAPAALLHETILRRASSTPDALAVVAPDGQLTYGELAQAATALAGQLRNAYRTGADTPVAVFLERGTGMVTALLGVLAAGAAYLPLDPDAPPARLGLILQDARTPVIITQGDLAARLPDTGARIVNLQNSIAAGGPSPQASPQPEQLAYLIHTSGSTGTPKGVQVTHAGLANLAQAMRRLLRIGPGDRVLAATTVSFDIAVLEILVPLTTGAAVVVATRDDVLDGTRLAALVDRHAVTLLQATPSGWQLLLDGRWRGRRLRALCGGEALSAGLAREIRERTGSLTHVYGPTETTVWSTAAELDGTDDRPPIGRPLDNTRVYILDAALNPVPPGVVGELYIGGRGVARGYLGRPALTAERFVPDPFRAGRLYRTGDLARYGIDGTLEFVGRVDRQLKIRGYRVEPGEIEAALSTHPAVGACAVVAHDGPSGPRLVAYVVGREQLPSFADLRAHLSHRLPAYMVPATWIELEALPLTFNGKLDVRALPGPDTPTDGPPSRPPRTPAERAVSAVLADVLGLPSIGIDEDFFQLGGDSLLAAHALNRLRQRHGLEISLRDLLRAPTTVGVLTAARMHARRPEILPASREVPVALSPGQLRLWFLHQLRPDRTDYHLPLAYILDGPLDTDALRAALAEITRRHDILRTRYVPAGDEPVQVADPPQPPHLTVTDLRKLPEHAREDAAARLRARLVGTPFDLRTEHPLRVGLMRLTDTRHHLVVVLHHIAADAWSLDLFTDELAQYYAHDASPPVPRLRYADYAGWQRTRQRDVSDDLGHWRERLRGLTPVSMPADRPRPPVPTARGAVHRHRLPASLAATLGRRARAQGTTLFTILLAGFHALIARYGQVVDVATATFAADRPHPDVEDLIGFFVDTLVIRSAPAWERRFTDHLTEVHEHVLDAQAHRALPYEQLVRELSPDRDPAADPFVRLAFTLKQSGVKPLALTGLKVAPLTVPDVPAKFDLSVEAEVTAESVELAFAYHPDLFDRSTISRLALHYERLLAHAAADPDTPIGELRLLTSAERERLVGASDGETALPAAETLDHAFHAQAARTPEAVAVSQGDRHLTYRELAEAANRLAHHLRHAHGVGPDIPVGVHLDRGLDLVTALLGTLTAGGTYLPLDMDHPPERHAGALAAAHPPVILTCSELRDRLPATDATVVVVDELPATGSAPSPGHTSGPDHLAYIVHTSGSTGRPKALAMAHRGAVNYLAYVRAIAALGPDDAVLQMASPGFDASLREILGPLSAGARVVFPDPAAPRTPARLVQEAAQRRITAVLAVVPSVLESLVHAGAEDGRTLPDLRVILASGEPLRRSLVAGATTLAPRARLINQYGPSECTMTATYASAGQGMEAEVLAGRPIPNMRCYVLDPWLQPVPTGVPGDVHLAGVGLARGYLGDPALTAATMLPDPYGPPGARMYRTGDRGVWTSAGDLRLLGRADRQVKVRGVRVEPGETEAALIAHPEVRQAAVVPRGSGSGLAGFYLPSPQATVTAEELRAHLRQKLPLPAVPDVLVPVTGFPLTTTGKIDYGALDDTAAHGPRSSAPRDLLELTTARVWAELLGVPRVGIDDDFFALGGHSLLAVRLVDRLERVLGRPVPLSLVFGEPTVRGLSQALRTGTAVGATGTVPLRKGGADQPPLFLVHPQSGDVCCYFDLAHALDADLPVHGLEAVGYGDDTPPLPTIERMARHYLERIRRIAPHGPYRLAGWSFGGNVAFELARLLERAGESVAFLGVIDSRVFGQDVLDADYLAKPELSRYAVIAEVDEAAVTGLEEEDALAILARHAVTTDRIPDYGSVAAVRRMVRVFTVNGRAAESYRPGGRVTADIHLFKAGRTHPVLPCPPVDPPGWARRTTGRLILETLPGDHHDLMREPCVTALAEQLSRALRDGHGTGE